MMHLPVLNLLERLALRILVKSPRTSLVIFKELDWPSIFVAANGDDPMLADPAEHEPASMQLERLYHAPSYGEEE